MCGPLLDWASPVVPNLIPFYYYFKNNNALVDVCFQINFGFMF